MNKKIALICGRSFTVKKFRFDLIKKMQSEGYDVSVIAFDNEYRDDILTWGVDYHCVDGENRSINPFDRINLIRKIRKVLLKVKPDTVLAFQTSPVIFGLLAAKQAKIPNIYSKIEGTGDVFIYNTLKWKIIRIIECILYKISFKYSKSVIFENEDDADEFLNRRLLKKEQIIVIPCVGVDVDKYNFRPIKNTNTFLMITRMKKSKGVIEFCEAARIVKKKYPEAVFNFIGNEFSLFVKDIKEFIDDGSINYLGYQEDIIPFIEESFVHVLPSYGEGFGLVTAQAASMGRPSIVTNVAGSKDSIVDKETGLLVKAKDANDLAEKMIYALNNKEEMIEMGKKASEFVKTNFNKDLVNEKVLRVIQDDD